MNATIRRIPTSIVSRNNFYKVPCAFLNHFSVSPRCIHQSLKYRILPASIFPCIYISLVFDTERLSRTRTTFPKYYVFPSAVSLFHLHALANHYSDTLLLPDQSRVALLSHLSNFLVRTENTNFPNRRVFFSATSPFPLDARCFLNILLFFIYTILHLQRFHWYPENSSVERRK